MIIINFKNYVHSEKALKLAQRIEKYLTRAVVAVSAVDIGYLDYYTKLEVFAQHVDLPNERRATGFLTIEAIKSQGASGTLLNHSEHPIGLDEINLNAGNLKKVGLKAVVCTLSLEFVEELLRMKNKPYAIAFEDPELIATGKSVTSYKSSDLKKFVGMLKGRDILAICGAGISSLEDVIVARGMGCGGVLIASAIADTKNPDKILRSLEGIKF